MLDFLKISTRVSKKGIVEVFPNYIVKKSSDLMIRGGDFYAVWVEKNGLWSTDEQDVLAIIDEELDNYAKENFRKFGDSVKVLHLWDSSSGMIDHWHKYCQKHMRDSFHSLDEKLIFSNYETKKEDYASKKLTYPLESLPTPSYDILMDTLYSKEERHKIEWAIGSVVSGDSKYIQKFIVLYGAAGTGKSTVLNIIQKLFDGYYSVFDARALGSTSNSFALESFKSNPLVAIQHDGDLSKIEDNTRLNSLVSHETMIVNEKFKSQYSNKFKSFLFMGTNKPVKITDAKSGLLRRLIDVSPSGNRLDPSDYKKIIKKIDFELGGIASHCLEVYSKDPGYYDDYVPTSMLGASNDFYNFVDDSYSIFKKEDGVSLKSAWEMYKNYCDWAKVGFVLPQRIFKEELKNYFNEYLDRYTLSDGSRIRSYYKGFKFDKFSKKVISLEDDSSWIDMKKQPSILDTVIFSCQAQYASTSGKPLKPWAEVDTTLQDIDTSRIHYVRIPENHIVIDFDIPDENGNKSLEKNIEEAKKWPKTYAELSKSGCGIHLHYIYTGNPSKLSRLYSDHVEIKVFTGNSSLRRKLTKCNSEEIASIGSGLPMKGEKAMINFSSVKNEKAIRTLIQKNLNKEIHPGTKPSIDFIDKILSDAYSSGVHYDVSDLRNAIISFASNSTNHATYCLKVVKSMKFKSEDASDYTPSISEDVIFFDVEVFPNLFILDWKYEGNPKVVKMINPSSKDIEPLLKHKLIGFNNRRYDNHILYACFMGYDNHELFKLSQKIINGSTNCFFGEAYNLSYTDIYDFASAVNKKSLKKFEIELGIHHQELGLPWDQPVPKDKWKLVAEYCENDVIATEAVFHHLKGDWEARKVLAKISGGTVNDTTNSLTAKLIFGNDRHPQEQFVYTDLSKDFPGYKYDHGVSSYRDVEEVGEGGRVWAKPGMYSLVKTFDVMSMHPHSIIALNLFGDYYTKRFKDLVDARVAVKHRDFETMKVIFNGAFAEYCSASDEELNNLAAALKTAINAVYGLTAANFDNKFRDPRNIDNIVAKRGALFMIDLQYEVEKRGGKVVHIKTDSIKLENPTKELEEFIFSYGKKWGYTFELESTYSKFCLINDAVYIALETKDDGTSHWTATGKQFAVPYVFKKLFSKEEIQFSDLCEMRSVTSELYLDMNEDLEDVSTYEKDLQKLLKNDAHNQEIENELEEKIKQGHNYIFVGKVGSFCPIKPGCGGGILLRKTYDKYYSISGTKGYRWLEAETVKNLHKESDIDISYYDALVDGAVDAISEFGDLEWFLSDDILEDLPWKPPCGKMSCLTCPDFRDNEETCKKGYKNEFFKAIK